MDAMGRKKYHRCSVLIVENSRDAIVCLFEFSLSKTNTSYEEFLNQHSHEIYHLCYHLKDCCQCKLDTLSKGNRLLNVGQLEQFYEKLGPKFDGHLKKGATEHCCSKAIPNITTDSLDVTSCRCLLEHFCDEVFWYSCIDAEKRTLETFLNINKHTLYHMWKGFNGNCCYSNCKSGMHVKSKLTDKYWNKLFKNSGEPCNVHRGRKDPICSMSARAGISIQDLDRKLSRDILLECCQLKRTVNHLVDIRNTHAHIMKASLTNDEYTKTIRGLEDDINFIGRICGKEREFHEKFKETLDQALDMDDFLRYQTILTGELAARFDKNQEEILDHLQSLGDQPSSERERAGRLKQQDLTHAEVEAHIKEGTFVRTDVITEGMELLESQGIVVLTGAAGSGKTRNGLEMMRLYVSQFEEYDIIKLCGLSKWKKCISINDKIVILFEDIFGKTNSRFNEDTDSRLLDELYASANSRGCNKVIITIRDTVMNSCEKLFHQQRILNDKLILDLNLEPFHMNPGEKLTCLQNYFKVTNIEATQEEENYQDKAIENKIITVKINNNTLQNIVQMKTAIGFPQAVYLFTGNRKFTRQGLNFFADASNCLLSEITELRRNGRNEKSIRWQYITLVYTMLCGGELRPKDIDRLLAEEILRSLYKRELPNDFEEFMQKSSLSLNGKYLSCKSGETHTAFTFQHQTTFEAVLVSYGEKEPASVIPFMSLEFITEIVRPYHYKQNPGETVLKIPHRHQDLLAKRLVEIMLSCYGTRKAEFVQTICKSEIVRLTEEEIIISMIKENESKMESRPSFSNLLNHSDKTMKPRCKTKGPTFHFTSEILKNIITYQDNEHVVEMLLDRISQTLKKDNRPEIRDVCRNTLITVLEQTCNDGTAHRLKIIYDFVVKHCLQFDVNRCMKTACRNRNMQCATWLFEESGEGESCLQKVMINASRENDVELVNWLLDNFDEGDLSLDSSIQEAYNNGHNDLVRNFIERVDIHENLELKYILTKSCCDCKTDLVKHLLAHVDHKHFDLTFSFNQACERGKLVIVKLMLNGVKDRDVFDMKTAIKYATQQGWKDLVTWLIRNNDQSLFDLKECLQIAIKYGRIELKNWLQQENSDLNADRDLLTESGKYFGQKF